MWKPWMVPFLCHSSYLVFWSWSFLLVQKGLTFPRHTVYRLATYCEYFFPTAGLVVYWSVTRAVQWIQSRIWSRRRCFILTSQNSYNPLKSWSLIQLLWNELSRYSLPRVCAHNSCLICLLIYRKLYYNYIIKNHLIFKHEFSQLYL